MKRWIMTALTMLALSLSMARPALAQDFEEWDDKAVEKAIQDLKDHLWSTWGEGSWGDGGAAAAGGAHNAGNVGGKTALCALALLAAGESPQEPRMKATLAWLAGCGMTGTYAVSLRAQVFAALGRNSEYRKNLQDDVACLVKGIDASGGYTYTPKEAKYSSEAKAKADAYDNSNSQLAVLGVWAGAMAGIEVPLEYWQRVERHWLRDQHPDGGWSYKGAPAASEAAQNANKSYGSMSVAGLATMFVCFDMIYSNDFIQCKADTNYKPLIDGLGWVEKNFDPNTNPGRGGEWYQYYLYGVERVGLASGYKYFGQKDWYKLGATALMGRNHGDEVNSAFALLFLARGQHPVLFNKLQYNGSWNSRPRDLANFTRWVTRTFEKPVNWQIIHTGVPVREWHDAPILYISGATAPKFSAEELAKIKEYVLQGGVIFSEAACNRPAFTMAMQQIYRKMFPEYELKRLPDDHPIYNLHFKVGQNKGIAGMYNGVRLMVIHSPTEFSLAWQTNSYATGSDIYQTAANMYFYVTDKGSLRKRGVSHWPKERPLSELETVKIAAVKYVGNWNPEPLALKRFAIMMANRHRIKVEIGEPAELISLDAAKTPVGLLTGTTAVTLDTAQQAALAKYVQAGGTLIVDAAGGSDAFANAMEPGLSGMIPQATLEPLPKDHAIYTKVGPPLAKVVFRRTSRLGGGDTDKPRLRALNINGRAAVIFSRDDLTAGLVGYPCWGLKGYEPASAFDVMRNCVLYASGKTVADDTAGKKPEAGTITIPDGWNGGEEKPETPATTTPKPVRNNEW